MMRFDYLDMGIEGMQVWLAREGDYSFVITIDKKEIRASWKNATFYGAQSSNYIDGNFKSLQQAESACRYTYKQLSRKN